MAVFTLEAPMPPLQLPQGSYLRLEAISPTTGAAITGVTVADVAVYATVVELAEAEVTLGPFMLVPGPSGAV